MTTVYQFDTYICILLPPFHIIILSSIAHIYIYVNESRHNIYMNVDNARKSYNIKQREYILPSYHTQMLWATAER